MTGTCETCVHFTRLTPDDLAYELGQSRYRKLPEGIDQQEGPRWGMCSLVVDTNDARDKPHSERAYPRDASGYHAWLTVREDFGCIEHTTEETP